MWKNTNEIVLFAIKMIWMLDEFRAVCTWNIIINIFNSVCVYVTLSISLLSYSPIQILLHFNQNVSSTTKNMVYCNKTEMALTTNNKSICVLQSHQMTKQEWVGKKIGFRKKIYIFMKCPYLGHYKSQ